MGIIVAIGGGEISELETLAIDQTIVDLTNKKNPKALFIPTASMDAEGYCDSFQLVYGDRTVLIIMKTTARQISWKWLRGWIQQA
ncbi:hypothetical protein BK146_24695 [Paenibacillus sp. FSL R7-0333]|nr:hypothetical protein BK146_24695 [Paenibacillus sp. FSL R7-0333]